MLKVALVLLSLLMFENARACKNDARSDATVPAVQSNSENVEVKAPTFSFTADDSDHRGGGWRPK